MSAPGWGLLPREEEEALHNISRLITIESRPFTRISTRLKTSHFSSHRPIQLPSPPPDASAADTEAADREAADREAKHEAQIAAIKTWQHDLMNEMELLDYAVLRMELTTKSNAAERERYAVEKEAITSKQSAVRSHIETLRTELDAARATLATRKAWDALAQDIFNNMGSQKSREDQAVAHAKLDEEIGELQAEVEGSKRTWMERRVQFGRIEEEVKEMLRMIKDEKEEAERKEGMMKEGDEGEEGGHGEGSTSRGMGSQIGTPRLETGAGTPMHGEEASQTREQSQTQSLRPPRDRLHSFSQSHGGSAAPSPGVSGAGGDTPMADKGDDSSVEEGEEEEDEGLVETMDET